MSESTSLRENPTAVWRGLLTLLTVAGIALLAVHATELGGAFTMDGVRALAAELGWWGPLALAGLGLVMPLVLLPRWPIAFSAGLLYGIVWGTALALPIGVMGAWLHYRLARGLLGGMADRWRQRSMLGRLNTRPAHWFWVLFLLRCFPLSHSGATNLIAGSLRVPQAAFIGSAILGMLPSTAMYASWGKLMKKPDPWFYGVAVALLIAFAGFTAIAQRRWLPRAMSATGSGALTPGEPPP